MSDSLPTEPTLSADQILEAVAELSNQIRTTDSLDIVMKLTVERVRHLLQAHRVVIYRFLPENNAVIAAESVASDWLAIQGRLIYDPCFENNWGDRYRQGHINIIADVQNSDIERCHIEMLTQLQVRANLVVPVFCQDTLWALLIAHHCSEPRSWQPIDIQLMQHVAGQLGQAVYQDQLRQQLQQVALQSSDPSGRLPAITPQQPGDFFQLFMQYSGYVLFVRDAVSKEFLYISPAYEEIWQRTCESLYANSSSWIESIHPDDLPQVQRSLSQQFEGSSVIREYRIIRKDGEVRWIHAHIKVITDEQQHPRYIMGWAEDNTERKQLQLSLEAAEETFFHRMGQERLLRNVTANIRKTLDSETILKTTATGVRAMLGVDRVLIYRRLSEDRLQVVNQSASIPNPQADDWILSARVLFAVCDEAIQSGHPCTLNAVESVDAPPEVAEFWVMLQAKSVMMTPIIQDFGAEESPFWGLIEAQSCDRPRHWQSSEADILQHFADQLAIAIHQSELYHQLQLANQELARLAKTDGLTQLANRRWLDEYLQIQWQQLGRQQKPLSLILSDVDHFKHFNDTYGHIAGDRCLFEIAQAIQHCIYRQIDVAARYGGEEFAIVLPETDKSGAIEVVERIRRALASLAIAHSQDYERTVVTLSFGIATMVPPHDTSFPVILEAADQALYKAKELGRNRYYVFGEKM